MNCSELSAFTESGLIVSHDGTNDAQNEGGVSNLGLTPPASSEMDEYGRRFEYFVTVAFPLNQKFKIKHVELQAGGRSRIVFNEIKYGDCTQDEQYRWLLHCMTGSMILFCDIYECFFEYTQKGNLHIHMRLGYNKFSKKSTMKDIRAMLHRMFQCSTQYTKFIDIKKYDFTRWNDYSNKYKKTYQTTHLPIYTNMDESNERNEYIKYLFDSPDIQI